MAKFTSPEERKQQEEWLENMIDNINLDACLNEFRSLAHSADFMGSGVLEYSQECIDWLQEEFTRLETENLNLKDAMSAIFNISEQVMFDNDIDADDLSPIPMWNDEED